MEWPYTYRKHLNRHRVFVHGSTFAYYACKLREANAWFAHGLVITSHGRLHTSKQRQCAEIINRLITQKKYNAKYQSVCMSRAYSDLKNSEITNNLTNSLHKYRNQRYIKSISFQGSGFTQIGWHGSVR